LLAGLRNQGDGLTAFTTARLGNIADEIGTRGRIQ
jgi:hypothetical protein